MITKSKEELLTEIQGTVESTIINTLRAQDMAGPNMNKISYAIGLAVSDAIRVLIENAYTDRQFEEDIGLENK
jgi:hypothetical protein